MFFGIITKFLCKFYSWFKSRRFNWNSLFKNFTIRYQSNKFT